MEKFLGQGGGGGVILSLSSYSMSFDVPGVSGCLHTVTKSIILAKTRTG